jgi:hypothetical protein
MERLLRKANITSSVLNRSRKPKVAAKAPVLYYQFQYVGSEHKNFWPCNGTLVKVILCNNFFLEEFGED